jgi:hypothetical protein
MELRRFDIISRKNGELGSEGDRVNSEFRLRANEPVSRLQLQPLL